MPCSSTTKPLSCPIIDSCLKLADSFPQTPSEQYYTQIQIDPMDSRIKTLKAKLGNKSLLLRRLPATGFTKNNPDWNLNINTFVNLPKYLLNPFESISSMSKHIIESDSTILRLKFLTENQRTQFFTCQAEQTRLGIPAEEVQSQSGITF